MAEYYLDVDYSDLTLTGTLTFTKDSTTVTGSGTAFTTELQTGDYIRSTDNTYGGTWYKVTGITDDTTLTINSKFLQDTHTASAERNRGDGSQSNPFCHLSQYTTDTVRSPGDILYVQNGQTLKCAWKIDFDEDGTADALIKIIGSDWKTTGSTTRFIIDLLGISYGPYINFYSDNFWKIQNIDITNGGPNYYGLLTIDSCCGVFAENVDISNGVYKNSYGIKITNASFYGKNIQVSECDNTLINLSNAFVDLIDVNFLPSETYTPNNGLVIRGSILNAINCNFSAESIKFENRAACRMYFVNTDYDSLTTLEQLPQSAIFDDLNNKIINPDLEISKEDTVAVNGVTPSIKVVTMDRVGTEWAIPVCDWQLDNVAAGTYTVTVNVRASELTIFPTADELYLEVEYLDEASPSTHVGSVRSTEVITANDTDTSLTATFTSLQDGKIRVRVWCGFLTSASAAIYVENGFTIN